MKWASMVAVAVAAAGEAKTVSYALIIGNNSPPAEEASLTELRFADDDAIRYQTFFSRFVAESWVLTVLDAPTQRRYPLASQSVKPPTLEALRHAVAAVKAKMASDRARGDETVLYLTYSGHGAQGSAGSFLVLADGALTRQVLYDEVLAELPATYVHLIIDACHAQSIVGTRGLSPQEHDAPVVKLGTAEVARVVESVSLRRFPHVGALLATSEGQESHEWSQFESGVFTHEVLSGFTGAADVNGDGRVEYSEIQAFIASANRDLRDPRAVPTVVALPPSVNSRAALVSLAALDGVSYLDGDFSRLGHFHVELDDGARWLDANLSSERFVRLAIPAGRTVAVVAGEKEAWHTGRAAESQRVSSLNFQPRTGASRGAIEANLRAGLFRSPFGPAYYRGYVDSAGVAPVGFEGDLGLTARASAIRSPVAVGTLVAGGVSLLCSGVFVALAALARNEFEMTSLQRPAAEAAERYRLFTGAWVGTLVGAGVLGIISWLIWPETQARP